MVANEASIQPISAWPCIRGLNLPPNSALPFFDRKKITMPALVLFIISMHTPLAHTRIACVAGGQAPKNRAGERSPAWIGFSFSGTRPPADGKFMIG